jgi:hypothetical protein
MNNRVTFEEKGFRDVRWCPYLNEPFIVEYFSTGEAHCPNCETLYEPGNYEESTHKFICHILKP